MHRIAFGFVSAFFSRSALRSVCLHISRKAQLRVSTASSSDERFAHNMWNPVMELLFHAQFGGTFEPFMDEIYLARIALSCHFALDVLCDKESIHDSA